jgi:hypothetical protein
MMITSLLSILLVMQAPAPVGVSLDLTRGALVYWGAASGGGYTWLQVPLTTPAPQIIHIAPLTGAKVAIAQRAFQTAVLIDPLGALAALEVDFPTAPNDGDLVSVSSSQTVTALTLSGGTIAIINPPTTMAAGGHVLYAYSAAGNKWFQIA